MNDIPPMSLESKLARRAGSEEYPQAVTQAERFVDDVTTLRMLRTRMPSVKPELFGMDNETIKHAHIAAQGAQLENWSHVEDDGTCWQGLVDVAYRFPDESLAIRLRSTGRWEVWRTW